jgi:hypothetical protein
VLVFSAQCVALRASVLVSHEDCRSSSTLVCMSHAVSPVGPACSCLLQSGVYCSALVQSCRTPMVSSTVVHPACCLDHACLPLCVLCPVLRAPCCFSCCTSHMLHCVYLLVYGEVGVARCLWSLLWWHLVACYRVLTICELKVGQLTHSRVIACPPL